MKSLLATAVVLFTAMSGRAIAQNEDPQQPIESAAAGLTMREFDNLGCYPNPGDMWDMGYYTFQASGWCQPLCVRQQARYFAMVNGTNCFCGNSAPPEEEQVSNNNCRSTCLGIDTQFCGGENHWQVYDDNYRNGDSTGTIQITTPSQTWFGMTPTSSSASSGSGQEVLVTTVVDSPAATTASESDRTGSSGTNTAGIVAGVVVGVVGLGAIIGGVFFFMRRKKQKELDAERRRHEALTNFVTRGEKPPSTFSGSDSRLEPSVMFQRRQSDGSIADNQDYSRRILKVTNPDDR